jgi:carboxylesterase type B
MIYLTPRITETFNVEELAMVNTLTTLWSNFVTSGNPNIPSQISLPQWPKYDLQNQNYYEINKVCTPKTDYTEEFLCGVFDDLPYISRIVNGSNEK